jgi:hypothetical protein
MSEGTKTIDTSDWPQGLVDIAVVIGPELTLELADKFGGVEKAYVPRLKNKVGLWHPWASVLGDEAWRAFCARFGGQKINLPRGLSRHGSKKRAILELATNTSLSGRSIARQVHCTETYVRSVVRGFDFTNATRASKRHEQRLSQPKVLRRRDARG